MIISSPEGIGIRLPRYECRGRFPALFEKRGTRNPDPGARRVMPRYQGAREFCMAWSRGMVRRHCLGSSKNHDEQNDKRPCRDDAAPSARLAIERRFRFGFDTFDHAITPTCCTATSRQGQSLRQAARGMTAMPSHRREDRNHFNAAISNPARWIDASMLDPAGSPDYMPSQDFGDRA